MWKSKKFIIAAALVVVIALASFGGIALAADDGEDTEGTATVDKIWDEMAAALQEDGVDVSADQLKDAFSTVMENRKDKALQDYLDKMVEEEKITQEQADAYREWMEAKPDMGEKFGLGNQGGMFRERIKMRIFDGTRGNGSMGFFGGSGGICPPAETE
jgi:hypothetical protein